MSLTSQPGWDAADGHLELIAMLRRQVVDRLAASGGQGLTDAERDKRVEELVDAALDEYAQRRLAAREMPLDPPVEARVARAARDWLTDLGPLTPLVRGPRNANIFINGKTVWVKRTDGSKVRLPAITSSDDELIDLVRDIATRVGSEERRFDRGVPRVSIRCRTARACSPRWASHTCRRCRSAGSSCSTRAWTSCARHGHLQTDPRSLGRCCRPPGGSRRRHRRPATRPCHRQTPPTLTGFGS